MPRTSLFVFVLRLKVPVNNFSVMSGRRNHFLSITSTFRGVKCLAQGHAKNVLMHSFFVVLNPYKPGVLFKGHMQTK